MFVFGTLLTNAHASDTITQSMDVYFSSWLKKIGQRTPVKINYTNNKYLAGQGEVEGEFARKWFLSHTFDSNNAKMYIQAFGHPQCMGTLSELLPEFSAFNARIGTIRNALQSIFVEFCCIVYDGNAETIYIISDKLGIVPAYIYKHDNCIFYSTALWVLKLLDHFDEDLNWQGIAEQLCFNAPIADRTIYKAVSRLVGGSIARFDTVLTQLSYYKLWEAYSTYKCDDFPMLLADNFNQAVTNRLTPHETEYSTLSGGLDSRTVVASLAKHQKKIVTFNFMPSYMLDAHLSDMFAKYIGAEHHQAPVHGIFFPNFSMLSRRFLDHLSGDKANESIAVWTGDDGSISLGFVYLRRQLLNELNLIENKNLPLHLFNNGRFSSRMLKKTWQTKFRELVIHGLSQFFEKVNVGDNAAKYYCFLMLNRVPRMFDEHFETAHLHRVLPLMPFLDVRTIEPVLSLDLPEASEHRLYLEFARRVSPLILEVPWQAYPGHTPCRLPLPQATNQWQPRDAKEERHLRTVARSQMLSVMKANIWQGPLRHEILSAYLLLDLFAKESRCGMARSYYNIAKSHEFKG